MLPVLIARRNLEKRKMKVKCPKCGHEFEVKTKIKWNQIKNKKTIRLFVPPPKIIPKPIKLPKAKLTKNIRTLKRINAFDNAFSGVKEELVKIEHLLKKNVNNLSYNEIKKIFNEHGLTLK